MPLNVTYSSERIHDVVGQALLYLNRQWESDCLLTTCQMPLKSIHCKLLFRWVARSAASVKLALKPKAVMKQIQELLFWVPKNNSGNPQIAKSEASMCQKSRECPLSPYFSYSSLKFLCHEINLNIRTELKIVCMWIYTIEKAQK